jgi:hypothetical protein
MRQLVAGASVPDRDSADILGALNIVAAVYNVDPAAIAGMIHTESLWDTRCVTGSYIGLTQVGPELPKLLKLTKDQFLDLSAAEQIQAYGKWLEYYQYTEQIAKYGVDVSGQPIARQAAVLQAMQFAPNGTKWKIAFARGDYSVPSTSSKQARFLGDTSIHDMEAYYGAFFEQYPPSYAGAAAGVTTYPAPRSMMEATIASTSKATDIFNLAAPNNASGSDGQYIPALLQIAGNTDQLVAAQQVAAQRLLNYDGQKYPTDGCAITLSVLLQEAGISVADTYLAFDLGNVLKNNRNWQFVPVGQQQAGDVGSTCGSTPHHGTDHIYLVLQLVNTDEMVVADNQAEAPHFRWASGKGGKSPTTFFLRASK